MPAAQSEVKYRSKKRGRSSAGRAPALHAGGREFDPPRLHQRLLVGEPGQDSMLILVMHRILFFKENNMLCVSRSSLKKW